MKRLRPFLLVLVFAAAAVAQDTHSIVPSGTDNPWPWISGLLALGNIAQFLSSSKDRQQARTDMMLMLPAITASTKALENLKE